MICVATIALGLTIVMIAAATPSAVAAPSAESIPAALTVRPSNHDLASGPKSKNNIEGMIVGLVLLGGWTATGAVMFHRARRRQRLEVPATRDAGPT